MRPLAPPAVPADDEPGSLSDLVAQALEGLETEGPAKLEALCHSHPEQAVALRARVQQLRAIGFVGAPSGEAPLPERIGGFRVLGRLGGGGMGVVLLAEQEDLQRRVALKLVRPELLHVPGARERFRREVEAVARLTHPGIVPVYTGGEDAGIPYYAMERVRGASLEELLVSFAGRDASRLTGADLGEAVERLTREREAELDERLGRAPAGREGSPRPGSSRGSSSGGGGISFAGPWTEVCMRIARAVAQALQHAHEQGVLHRDVKPSNIMLTPAGRVLLLDFGLATAEGSERITVGGAPLGSLAWMSPEQVRGEHATLDARTDVYSLGATLYELLGLRSPFTGGDVETTRQRILEGRLIPLRDLNASVPRDAETVCRQAMETERERRYADAAAFARDLDNALERRPVLARRPGPLLKLRSWARRHPASSVALVAGLLLFVGGPLAYAWQQREAKLAIGAAYDEAAAQRTRAEANFARAQQAVDVLLTQVAEEDLLDVPYLEPVRRRLLESALGFYEDFLTERTDDPTMKRLVTRATDRCGYLLMQLGRDAEACEVYQRQAGLAGELLAAAPDDDELLDLLGKAETRLGFMLLDLGRLEEAATAGAEGLRLRRERAARRPDDWAALLDVDESLGQCSSLASASGRADDTLAADRESVAWNETLLGLAATDSQHLAGTASLVTALGNQAAHCKQLGRVEDALEAIERAIELSAPHLQELAGDPELALGAANVRMIVVPGGDPATHEQRVREAIAILETALERSPRHTLLRRMLATGWNNLGGLLDDDPARHDEARIALQTAIGILAQLVVDVPGVPRQEVSLGSSLVNLGAVERNEGDAAGARAHFEEALQRTGGALAQMPDDAAARNTLFNAAWFLGLTCLDMGDDAGCAAAADEIVRGLPDETRPLLVAAGLLARAATSGSPDEAAARAEDGLRALRLAVDAGFSDTFALDDSANLAGLRGLPGFADIRAAAKANGRVEP